MASALITMQKSARAGETIQIKCLVGHNMESGYRPGADGKILPADLIRKFKVSYVADGSTREIFSSDFFSAVAANPFIAFYFRVPLQSKLGTAQLVFQWQGDRGFTHSETVALTIT